MTKQVFVLQESSEERDGLSVAVDVCATLEAAKTQADARAGRFALEGLCGEWYRDAGYYHENWQPWTRRMGDAFQHIQPAELHEETTRLTSNSRERRT